MRPTVEELLAQLPPLPDLDRPFLTEDSLARSLHGPDDFELLRQLLSGTYYDVQLARLLEGLPAVRERVASLGPAGLTLRARPTNTINALTAPGRNGTLIVFNIGFASFLHTVATALAAHVQAVQDDEDRAGAVLWLAHTVDWATSPAAEPRIAPIGLELDGGLAANAAGRAQDFALCHELGHTMAESDPDPDTELAEIAGQAVEVIRPEWALEHDADRRGLELHLEVLAHRGEAPVGALIGAEVFLNGAAMLAPDDPSPSSHPPPDDRLFGVRQHWAALVPDPLEQVGPAVAVRGALEALRDGVRRQVAGQRAAVRAQLEEELDDAAVGAPYDAIEGRRIASGLAHHLLASPGATLAFLRDELGAPRTPDEVVSYSPRRLLAHNAGLHLEPALREVIGLITPGAAESPRDI